MTLSKFIKIVEKKLIAKGVDIHKDSCLEEEILIYYKNLDFDGCIEAYEKTAEYYEGLSY